jgi:hypothetical protein
MEDHPQRDDLIAQMTRQLIIAYALVVKALAGLPIPIEVPPMPDTQHDPEIHARLVRAIALLEEIPVDPVYAGHIRGLVIDWLTASDYLADAREDWALWKADFVVTQLTRVHARWKHIEGLRETLE